MQAAAPDSHADALQRIRDLLGPAGCIDAPELTARFLTDFRGLYHGATPFVACPATTAEVAQVLALCNEARIAVVPQGGNTSYCGGATPSARGDQLVLSLHRLNRIRAVDAANFSLVAEAGCVLLDVQAAAQAVDRLFPLSLGSEGSCQIGGNLSTNAGGLAAVRYGVTRDLVLGLEVVLADGRVIDGLSSLRKDNTGYDLRDLFIGAEGTLGIITAASLKLFPQPRTIETAFVAVPGMQAAVDLLARLREATGDCVTTFEYLPRIAVEFTVRHIPGVSDPLGTPHPAYVLCEVSTARHDPHLRSLLEDALGAAMNRGDVLEATFAESIAQREALWRLRESVPEAQRHEGASIKHDVVGARRRAARLPAPGERGSRASGARRASRGLRPRRRRQPALQSERARGRRRPRWVPGAAGGPRSRRACLRAGVPGLDQRRARHRPAQARVARAPQGPGRARGHAVDQAGPRSARNPESGQGPAGLAG